MLTKLFYCCQWASSSVYYLLGLWSRLVTSVPYLKGDAPSLLDEFVPKITEGFITSRFNSVQVLCYVLIHGPVLLHSKLWLFFFSPFFWFLLCCNLQAGLPDDLSENPLDNVELLQDQLDCFPYLCRFQVKSVHMICSFSISFMKIYLQFKYNLYHNFCLLMFMSSMAPFFFPFFWCAVWKQ